jgi:hypothetical protein
MGWGLGHFRQTSLLLPFFSTHVSMYEEASHDVFLPGICHVKRIFTRRAFCRNRLCSVDFVGTFRKYVDLIKREKLGFQFLFFNWPQSETQPIKLLLHI